MTLLLDAVVVMAVDADSFASCWGCGSFVAWMFPAPTIVCWCFVGVRRASVYGLTWRGFDAGLPLLLLRLFVEGTRVCPISFWPSS